MSVLLSAGTELDPRVVDFVSRPRQMYIDGQWTDALSGRRFDTVDPATEEVVTTVPHSGVEDVELAVKAARRAFDGGPWRTMTPAERQRILWKIGEGITARAEQFAQLETLDNGKSVAVAKAVDVTWAAEIFYYYAGWVTKIEGRTIPVSVPWAPGGRFHAFTLREPVGVCAQIVPWNFPLVMAAFKVAPALACGNTAILKPAEQTPLTALLLAEVIAEAGVPDGVFNVLTGFGDSGPRCRRTTTSTRSRSPVPPRSARRSSTPRRATSRRCRWNSAARARRWCSPMPTCRQPSPVPPAGSCSTTVRPAPRAPACWSRTASSTSSRRASRSLPAVARSARGWTPPTTSARWCRGSS